MVRQVFKKEVYKFLARDRWLLEGKGGSRG